MTFGQGGGQPPQTQQPASGEQFKCPQCGGQMTYDAQVQGLRCGYCKHTMPVPQGATSGVFAGFPTGPGPREIPISQGLSMAPKGLGTPLQTVQCRDCGATVNLGPNERTATCTYCASNQVVPQAPDPNLITPESLVPFQVPKERASGEFKNWIGGLWFRPNNLKAMAQLEAIVGVYVPFWTFDAHVDSQWQAERGWYYYETEYYTTVENGETVQRERQVQRTRWESAWGSRHDFFDDVLVCGSKGLPANLVSKMTTFNTKALVGYQAGYLAGWRAESYAIDLPLAWQQARANMDQQVRARCGSDVGGDTHQGLSVNANYSKETFKHVLLPVYVAAYRYNNKPYRFLVNGQTGEVVGEAPYSFWKIALTVLFFLAIAAIIAVVVSSREGNSSRPRFASPSPSAVAALAPPTRAAPAL